MSQPQRRGLRGTLGSKQRSQGGTGADKTQPSHQRALLTSPVGPEESERSHRPLCHLQMSLCHHKHPLVPWCHCHLPGAASQGEQRAGDRARCPIFKLNTPKHHLFIVICFQVLFVKENSGGWYSGCPAWFLTRSPSTAPWSCDHPEERHSWRICSDIFCIEL